MKKTLPLILLFALLVYLLPMVTLLIPHPSGSSDSASSPAPSTSSATSTAESEDTLLILDEDTDTVMTVSMRDYVLGAAAAEMPMTYSDEALRAQDVYKRQEVYSALSLVVQIFAPSTISAGTARPCAIIT